MSDDFLVVEIPLADGYLTEDGLYYAGYLWGQHYRDPDDPDVQRQPQTFIDGVRDGYGDVAESNRERLALREKERRELESEEKLRREKLKTGNPIRDEMVETYADVLKEMQNNGIVSEAQALQMLNQVFEAARQAELRDNPPPPDPEPVVGHIHKWETYGGKRRCMVCGLADFKHRHRWNTLGIHPDLIRHCDCGAVEKNWERKQLVSDYNVPF